MIALLSVAALIGSGIAWATYRQFTQGIQHGFALPKVASGKKDIDGKDQNILLLGNDSIAGATAAEVRALGTTTDRNDAATDTMMILHVPADGSKATIISFPRDSWVAIPNHGMGKINARVRRRIQRRRGPGRARPAEQAERRHHPCRADPDQQPDRPAHRPLRADQPARLL